MILYTNIPPSITVKAGYIFFHELNYSYGDILFEVRSEVLSGIRSVAGSHLLGSTLSDDIAAAVSALRTKIDDMVSHLYHIKVMLDDKDSISLVSKALKDIYQAVYVSCMETGSRFVKYIDSPSCCTFRKLCGELDTLSLSAGKSSRRLSYADITKTNILKGFELSCDLWQVLEKLYTLINSHFQNIVNGLSLIMDFQCLTVIALALADFTGDINIRQEVHFYLDYTVALAGFTASSLDIEGESSAGITMSLSVGSFCKQITDIAENSGIGCRV